jgi:dipeptidyl aminopeptidase/acylaminoacyl peptidase
MSKYLNYILIGIIILLVIWVSFTRSSFQKAKRDVKILKDSTEYVTNLNKELYARNNSAILEISDLKEYNKELYNEVKKLKDNPIVVTKVITKIEYRDTTLITVIDSTYFEGNKKIFKLGWSKDTIYSEGNYFNLKGKTFLSIDTTLKPIGYYSYIQKLEIGSKLYLSLTENKKDKNLYINARTDFPGLIFTDIDGYIIDPQKSKELKKYFPQKRWGISVFGGPGVLIGNEFKAGWIMGVGISYDILNF